MTASAAKQPAILEVPLSELVPSPFNARKHFDRDQLAELAGSIRTEGIIQPLLVRIVDGRYQIIAGERRFRAAKLADLDRVPCILHDGDEASARRKQIIENLQREGIGPLEEAQAFQDLLKAKGDKTPFDVEHLGPGYDAKGKLASEWKPSVTVDGLAKELGKSKEYVYGRLKLLKLGEAAKKALEAGKIEAGHAVELVPLDEAKQEKALAYIREIASDGETVSVKGLRDEIKYSINPPPAPKRSAPDQARDKKFREQQAAEQKRWKKQEEERRSQREHDQAIDARVLAALWAFLNRKETLAKNRERFTAWLIADELESIDVGDALDVVKGKPAGSGGYSRHKEMQKHSPDARIAIGVLALAIQHMGYGGKPSGPAAEILGWAKIDRKKIATEIAREAKAKAAGEAAPRVSTSAKAAGKATAKGKARGQAKRKK